VDGLWATKSEGVGLIIRAISCQDFQPMWSQSTNVTDGRTDSQTDDMQSQDRALHYRASRGKNRTFWYNDIAYEHSACSLRHYAPMIRSRHTYTCRYTVRGKRPLYKNFIIFKTAELFCTNFFRLCRRKFATDRTGFVQYHDSRQL